jgi:hypothetical protein
VREPGSGRRRRAGSLVFHGLAFAAALALLAWCVRLALDPPRAPGEPGPIAQVAAARPDHLLGLIGLSLLSLALNGLIFHSILRPVRRLDVPGVLATNALATFLAYLPFKISLMARLLVHHRRDGVGVLVVLAWLAATAAIVLAVIAPVLAVALLDLPMPAAASAALLASAAAVSFVVVLSRLASTSRGRGWMVSVASSVPGRAGRWAGRAVADLHAAFRMLGTPSTVVPAAALRLADLAAQAARFLLAAHVLGVALEPRQALILAGAHFLAGVLSPVGMLGAREGTATGVGSLLAAASAPQLAGVALLVGAADAALNVVAGPAAAAFLRLDRLLRLRAPPAGS